MGGGCENVSRVSCPHRKSHRILRPAEGHFSTNVLSSSLQENPSFSPSRSHPFPPATSVIPIASSIPPNLRSRFRFRATSTSPYHRPHPPFPSPPVPQPQPHPPNRPQLTSARLSSAQLLTPTSSLKSQSQLSSPNLKSQVSSLNLKSQSQSQSQSQSPAPSQVPSLNLQPNIQPNIQPNPQPLLPSNQPQHCNRHRGDDWTPVRKTTKTTRTTVRNETGKKTGRK